MAQRGMSIGALARRAASSVQTIRYYESIALLPRAPRTSAGRRFYDENHLRRLAMVRSLRNLRFSIPEVRALLSLIDDGAKTCTDARTIATTQRDRLRAEIAAALALEKTLSRYVDCCEAACAARPPEGIRLQDVLARAD